MGLAGVGCLCLTVLALIDAKGRKHGRFGRMGSTSAEQREARKATMPPGSSDIPGMPRMPGMSEIDMASFRDMKGLPNMPRASQHGRGAREELFAAANAHANLGNIPGSGVPNDADLLKTMGMGKGAGMGASQDDTMERLFGAGFQGPGGEAERRGRKGRNAGAFDGKKDPSNPFAGIPGLGARGENAGMGARGGHGMRGMPGMPGADSPPPGKVYDPSKPLKLEHVEDLDSSGFADKVEAIARIPEVPVYFPLVFFYSETCKFCSRSLFEFDQAAEIAANATKDGKLNNLAAPTSYFVFQCDKSSKSKVLCAKHEVNDFPVVKLYRDNHSYVLRNAQWTNAQMMAGWAAHMSRPALLKIETRKEVETIGEDKTIVLITSDAIRNSTAINAVWTELAFTYLETYFFAVVPVGSAIADDTSMMPIGSSAAVIGKHMVTTPLTGKLSKRAIRKWFKINRWPAVTKITPQTGLELAQSGQEVVVFSYVTRRKNMTAVRAKLQIFDKKAREMRNSIHMRANNDTFIFATIDVSGKEQTEFMSKHFGLVSVPSIFIFESDGNLEKGMVYWEDPSLTPDEDLTIERLDILKALSWARVDSSHGSLIKGLTKRVYRFVSGSVIGVIIFCLTSMLILGVVLICVCENSDYDEPRPPAGKELKQD